MTTKPEWILAVLGLAAIGLFGCSAPAETGSFEGEPSSELTQALVPSTSSEYKLPAGIDPDVLSDRATELWARVYRPITLTAGVRYPVLLFLHGNHSTCGHGSNPRIDDNSQYTTDGTCPSGYVVAPSHNGYTYLATQLASNGYIVVSVNANRGINAAGGVSGDSGLNLARGRLLLKHLTVLSQWDRGVTATPGSLGADFTNHLDLSQVGLLGHSRGGEGARAAYAQYLDVGSPWPARIVTPVSFRGIFEIGPVDGQTSRTLDVSNTHWSVLLPMCDGDVSNLQGVKPFDRVQAFLTESPPGFKSTVTAWGTNHNYYNTEWQQSDSSGCTGTGNPALFSSGPGITGSPEQRTVSSILTKAFFLGNVGVGRDPSQNAIFDPSSAIPSALSSVTRVDRGFTPSPDTSFTQRLEDFINATGTSSFAQPNDASGVSVTHTTLPEHDFTLRGGSISWTSGGSNTYFQTNFAPIGLGFSLVPYNTLDLRVELASSPLNVTPTTDFSVQLVNAQNQRSVARRIAQFVSLTGPVGGPFSPHSMLQTARIPLTAFGMPLNSIRGVRLLFNATASGAIYVTNIRATTSATGFALAPPATIPLRPTLAPAAPAPVAAAAPRVITSGQIVSVGATLASQAAAGGVDIEVSSSTSFPVIDDLFVLRVGGVDVDVSRYPDPADMQRLVFTLDARQYAALRAGDAATVNGGGTLWKLGAYRP